MTPRPGRISAVIDIDLPRPRTLEVEQSDAFVQFERRLRSELLSGTHSIGAPPQPLEGGS